MPHTRVQLGFSVYDPNANKLGSLEDFNLSFTMQEETLGTIFDKFEVMLKAMGFVLDGMELRLVDRDKDDDRHELAFLAERSSDIFDELNGGELNGGFTVFDGGKS